MLGTFVEIEAGGANEAELGCAVDAAFRAIGRVESLMSVHDPESELSRVNEGAAIHPVKVSAETFEVLRRGLELSRDSDGAFDFTVAPLLARWGLLPAHLRRCRRGNWRDVLLLPRHRVRFAQPLAIDLGGIAKGHAVDAAIETLSDFKVSSALVNAGGDLRVFGSLDSDIHLRHPVHAHLLDRILKLRNAALATSSPCFSERRWRRSIVSHLVDPFKGRAVTGAISVSVRARQCWLADALTKIVLAAPKFGEHVLARHNAEAFILTA